MFETSRATEANQSNNKILTASTKKRQEFYEQRSLSDGTIVSKDKAVEGRVVRGRKNPYWLDFTIELEKSSPNYAIAVAAMSVLSVTLLGLYGNPWAASIVGGLEVVSLVSLFVYGKRNQGKGS